MDKSVCENEFWAAVQRNSIIDTVRWYRVWTNEGFKDSANYVKRNWEQLRLNAFAHDGNSQLPKG